MTEMENKKLDLILNELYGIKEEQKSMRTEMADMRTEMADMRTEMTDMRTDITGLQTQMTGVQEGMKSMRSDIRDLYLHLEHVTDKNIMLLAENHINLVNKLREAIPIADKNLVYEVKVSYALETVAKLEKEVADLKNKIA